MRGRGIYKLFLHFFRVILAGKLTDLSMTERGIGTYFYSFVIIFRMDMNGVQWIDDIVIILLVGIEH